MIFLNIYNTQKLGILNLAVKCMYINLFFRYMETCRECPYKYPWLKDAKGTGLENDVYNIEKEEK